MPMLTLAKSSITVSFATTAKNFFAYPAIDPASLLNHLPSILFDHTAGFFRDCSQA
jgi:hypothetical protein